MFGGRIEEGGFVEKFEGFFGIGGGSMFVGRADVTEIGIFGRSDVALRDEAEWERLGPAAKESLADGGFEGEMATGGKSESFSASGEDGGVERTREGFVFEDGTLLLAGEPKSFEIKTGEDSDSPRDPEAGKWRCIGKRDFSPFGFKIFLRAEKKIGFLLLADRRAENACVESDGTT